MMYKHLFPYEKVPCGSRIVIYGAGELGLDYLRQMKITKYCRVVAMVDRNHQAFKSMSVPVCAPSEISSLEFDHVVVALRTATGLDEIKANLRRAGVPDEKIVCIFERNDTEFELLSGEGSGDVDSGYAYDKSDLSIALLLTGGIGDHVIQKRMVMELAGRFPECLIDIYAVKNRDFLEYIYSDCRNVNYITDNAAGRYSAHCPRYSFAMSVEGCAFVSVDRYDRDRICMINKEFSVCADKITDFQEKEHMGISIPLQISHRRSLINGKNAYTFFTLGGAFEISDQKVSIPLSENAEKTVSERFGRPYITISCGNGQCSKTKAVAKSWVRERFEKVLGWVHDNAYDYDIIQLGMSSDERLEGADHHVFGEKMQTVAQILKFSSLHLDIESGLVHIASQLGTRCVVLAGPSLLDFWRYDENRYITAGECQGCSGLYSNMNECARHMEEPECMYSITVDMVTETLKEELDRIKEADNV